MQKHLFARPRLIAAVGFSVLIGLSLAWYARGFFNVARFIRDSVTQIHLKEAAGASWVGNALTFVAVLVGLATFLVTLPSAVLSIRDVLLRSKNERTDYFPFAQYEPDSLAALRKVVLRYDIPRCHLYDDGEQLRLDHKIANTRRLLLIGRSGLGKTRAALDAISRIVLDSSYDGVTVLVPTGRFDIPTSDLPIDFKPRRLVVFIDDVEAELPDSVNATFGRRPFSDKLNSWLELFEQRGIDVRTILTARTDSKKTRERLIAALPDFSRESLRPINKKRVLSFARTVSTHLKITLMPDAAYHILQESDQTCGGITSGLVDFQMSANGSILTLGAAQRLPFHYPHDWAVSVYPNQIANRPIHLATLRALKICKLAHFPPTLTVVTEIAMCLLSTRFAWRTRKRIREAIDGDLSVWIARDGNLLTCPPPLLAVVQDADDDWRLLARKILADRWRNQAFRKDVESNLDRVLPRVGRNRTVDTIEILDDLLKSTPRHEGLLYLKAKEMASGQKDLVGASRLLETVRIRRPYDIDAANLHSLVLGKLGELEQAIAVARVATGLGAASFHSWLLLGVLLDHAKRTSEALDALSTACRLNPKNAKAHYSYGIALENDHRYEEAGAEYRRATELAPGDPAAWYTIAVFEFYHGDIRSAQLCAERAHNLNPSSRNSLMLASTLAHQKDFRRAAEILQCALVLDPTNDKLYGRIVNVLISNRLPRVAYDFATEFERRAPDDPRSLALIGRCQMYIDPSDAVATFIKLKMQRGTYKDLCRLANALRVARRYSLACIEAIAAIQLYPKSVAPYDVVARSIRRLPQGTSSAPIHGILEESRRVLLEYPSHRPAKRMEAMALSGLERYTESEAAFEAANAMPTVEKQRPLFFVPPELTNQLGRTQIIANWEGFAKNAAYYWNSAAFFAAAEPALSSRKVPGEAWDVAIEHVLRLAPTRGVFFVERLINQHGPSSDRLHLLAAGLRHCGRPEDALPCAEASVEREPRNAKFLYLLGRIYMMLPNRDADAAEMFMRVLTEAPKHPQAANWLNVLLSKRGTSSSSTPIDEASEYLD